MIGGRRSFHKPPPRRVMVRCGEEGDLVFTSYGFCRPGMTELFEKAIPREGLAEKTCLLIPFAGYSLEKTIENERLGLIKYGFLDANITVAEEGKSFPFKRYDYIYVPGGDPFRLRDAVERMSITGFLRKLVKERGTTYIGVSAGAYLATGDMGYVSRLESCEHYQCRLPALGLFQANIVCHAEHYSEDDLKACRRLDGTQTYHLRDDQLMHCSRGSWKLYAKEDEE